MFESLPYEPREIKATETRLQRIYDAAYKGLKGDSLALAAGMMPTEYRRLCQMDPMAEMAEMKGRADSELKVASTLHKAAAEGDAKAALELLKHSHGWTAKQEITVDVYQKISITQALADAQMRVIEGTANAKHIGADDAGRAERFAIPPEQPKLRDFSSASDR